MNACPDSLSPRILSCALALAAGVLCCNTSQAAVVMDQIGSDPNLFTGANTNASQIFTDMNNYDIVCLDDFAVTDATLNITHVFSVMGGWNGFTTYGNVTAWDVNIYSSTTAASTDINGDVAHVVLAPVDVTITAPYCGDALSSLVDLPVNILLPAAGTYYVGVLAEMSFSTGRQLGVYVTSDLTSPNPGGLNGSQANPGGAFGIPGNLQSLSADLAYRVIAVPEPSTVAAGLGILTLAGCLIRRRR